MSLRVLQGRRQEGKFMLVFGTTEAGFGHEFVQRGFVAREALDTDRIASVPSHLTRRRPYNENCDSAC